MKALEFLEQIRKLRAIRSRKVKEIEKCRDRATRVTSQMGSERVQASGSMSKMADESIKIADIQKDIDAIDDTIADVIKVLERLKTEEYIVLYGMFVEYLPAFEIAEQELKSVGWVYKARKKGLDEVQKILDGKK